MNPADLIGKTIHDIVCPLCSERLAPHDPGTTTTFRCANEKHGCVIRVNLLNQGLKISRLKIISRSYSLTYLYTDDKVYCFLADSQLGDDFISLPFKDWTKEEFKMMLVFL